MDWGDVATWIGALAAVAAAGVSWWQAVRSRRSARASEADSRRAADAAERLVALAEESARNAPPWIPEQVGQHRYRIVRNGAPVYGVTVRGDYLLEAPVTRERVDSGGAVDFLAARTAGDQDEDIIVSWYSQPDRAGEPAEWRHPLP